VLAQAQLTSRQAYAEHVDTLALGMLGFDAALITIVVAAQKTLGSNWFVPLFGLGISSLAFMYTFAIGRRNAEIGPDPGLFYGTYGGKPTAEFNGLLLVDIVRATRSPGLRRKQFAFAGGFFALFVTLLVALGLFV
jgi:hypothetical protein